MKLFCISILAFIFNFNLLSQENNASPTPVEFLFGNNRIQGQIILVKNFSPNSRFGFFSLSALAGSYSNKANEIEIVSQNFLNYKLYQGVSITGGAIFNYKKGLLPQIGLQYNFLNKNWLIIAVPSIQFSHTNFLETMLLAEFRPQIKNGISLYSRLQGLYNYNMASNTHDRSFINMRIGLSYQRLSTGFGSNLDYYGSMKIAKRNFGIFFKYNFQ